MPSKSMIDYPFTREDAEAAWATWKANCGPFALAFACQVNINQVRGKIPGFEEKHYTNPTMMKAGLKNLGKTFDECPADTLNMFRKTDFGKLKLCRLQWTGPWTKPGANAKWAYTQTHWICSWVSMEERGHDGEMTYIHMVFDCNGGIQTFEEWIRNTVPMLTKMHPRSDGGFYPTHVWRIALS